MKKRIISFLLVVGMVFYFVACGESGDNGMNSEIMSVTVEGNEYDLNDNFQEVVGRMVKDGLIVSNPFVFNFSEDDTIFIYNENGNMYHVENTIMSDDKVISGEESEVQILTSPVLGKTFILNCLVEYETSMGISADSTVEELERLEGYTYYEGYFSQEQKLYYALYMDGKLVDLEEYREEYEAWIEDVKALGVTPALYRHLIDFNMYMEHRLKFLYYDEETILQLIQQEKLFENQMLLVFAVIDAGRMLESKEIASYDYIEYSYDEDFGVEVCFEHFVLDEEKTFYDPSMREYRENRIDEILTELLNE